MCNESNCKCAPASSSASPPQPVPHSGDPKTCNIPETSKLPLASIKSIIQADEDVGKLRKVVPVAVGKATELFMTSLVSATVEKAREEGVSRITAKHLKKAIDENPEPFDFLQDIAKDAVEMQGEALEATKRIKGTKTAQNHKLKDNIS